jgi:hypothetical protein
MTTKTETPTYTFLAPARLGFCHLITAHAFQPKPGQTAGDPRYDAQFILEPDNADLVAIKNLVGNTLKTINPGKKLVARRLTQEEMNDGGTVEINVPWSDGTRAADVAKEKGKDMEWARGKILLKASSKFSPTLSAVQNGKIVAFTDPATRAALASSFYSGAWVGPMLSINGYKSKGDANSSSYKPGGAGLWLNAVHFVKHDTKLIGGGGINAAEVFKGYAGQASTVDPGSNDEF